MGVNPSPVSGLLSLMVWTTPLGEPERVSVSSEPESGAREAAGGDR